MKDHPNLLVVQTLSKSRALAGLRVGFAIGQAPLIEALVRVKDSFNSYPLDRLALVGATAAIEDEAWFEEACGKVITTRSRLTSALESLDFEVLPSTANFVFARHRTEAGGDLAQKLRSAPFWSATSGGRESKTTCASASGRMRSATGWWRR